MSTPSPSRGPIRVVLVDDSPICRYQLTEILQADGRIEVVGVGSRGEEALTLLARHQPDMMVVDLVMPGQGGQETIALVMARHPLPILVVTAQPEGVRQVAVFDAIRRGALDLAEKPRRGDRDAEERLRRSIHTLAHIPVVRHIAGNQSPSPQRKGYPASSKLDRKQEPMPGLDAEHKPTSPSNEPIAAVERQSDWPSPAPPNDGVLVVGIGASAGGPTPLAVLLGGLPRDFPAALAVVQHLPVGFTDAFCEYLRGRIVLTVKKVEGREAMRPGIVYLPTDNQHLVTVSGGYIATTASSGEPYCPSVDVLFESLAKAHGRRSVSVILSGIGQDGVRGMLAMRDKGSLTMAQSEESCAVFGMPQAAFNYGAARLMLTPEAMVKELQRHVAVQTPWRLAR